MGLTTSRNSLGTVARAYLIGKQTRREASRRNRFALQPGADFPLGLAASRAAARALLGVNLAQRKTFELAMRF